MTPLTRHLVSGEGVSFFFPVYYKLKNFKLVHSYNVKHLVVLYSIVVDYKIYTSSINGSVQHLQYL